MSLARERTAGYDRTAVYHSFRSLLTRYAEMLEWFDDLRQRLDLGSEAQPGVRDAVGRTVDAALRLCTDACVAAGARHTDCGAIDALEQEVRRYLTRVARSARVRLAATLPELGIDDAADAGVKAARLGALRGAGVGAVPEGFVVTTAAYRLLCESEPLAPVIREGLAAIREEGLDRLPEHAARIRAAIRAAPLPPEIERAIMQHAARLRLLAVGRWAVRSSAVGEDALSSFAGQFDTLLNVATVDLADAYRTVVASRFTERAISYRLAGEVVEVESPMPVLFMPMIDAAKSGVVYTRDPHDPEAGTMWITGSWGLGADVTSGGGRADLYVVKRDPPGELREMRAVDKVSVLVASGLGIERQPVIESQRSVACLLQFDLGVLARCSLAAERHLGEPQELEWAIDHGGRLWLLQARPLIVGGGGPPRGSAAAPDEPLLEGGQTVFPGRVVGRACVQREGADAAEIPLGAILVVRYFDANLARALARVGGLIVEAGRPEAGMVATIRRLRVPAVWGLRRATTRLHDGDEIGLDATERKVHGGVPWPELRRRSRPAASGPASGGRGVVRDRIAGLHLEAGGMRGRPGRGRASLRDLVETMYERAIAAMLDHEDRERRDRGGIRRLTAQPPLGLRVLDLGDGLVGPDEGATITPPAIASVPFKALWRGVRATGLVWSETFAGPGHLVVSREWMCLSARLGPHLCRVDARVGPLRRRNFTAVQFRAGGAGHRAEGAAWFVDEVLARSGYEVDRGGRQLTATVRGYPPEAMERALDAAGRLIGCLRALETVTGDEEQLADHVERFERGAFEGFGKPDGR